MAVPIMVVGRLCLLLIGQHDCHTPQRVQNLLGVLVTHRVFQGAVQQLCKEVLDVFHNGLLFFGTGRYLPPATWRTSRRPPAYWHHH